MTKNEYKTLPLWLIQFTFWLGIFAGIAVRSLSLLNRVSPELGIWVWRFAMLSYTFFFGYRYLITKKRRRIIIKHDLISEIEASTALDPATQQATLYLLKSVIRSKELFNYAFICILSFVAVLLDFIFG